MHNGHRGSAPGLMGSLKPDAPESHPANAAQPREDQSLAKRRQSGTLSPTINIEDMQKTRYVGRGGLRGCVHNRSRNLPDSDNFKRRCEVAMRLNCDWLGLFLGVFLLSQPGHLFTLHHEFNKSAEEMIRPWMRLCVLGKAAAWA